MSYPRRLLVSRLSAMGDVAMTLPVLIELNRSYPDVEVFMLSQKRFEPLFKSLDFVTFIEADIYGRHKGPAGLYRLSRAINKLRIDAHADFHDVLRTKVLRKLVSAFKNAYINKGRSEKKRLISDPGFFKPLKHTTQRYLDVLIELGYNLNLGNSNFLNRIEPSEEILKFIRDQDKPIIGFAPFAAHRTKALSNKKAKSIVKELNRSLDATIVLIGGGEKEKKKLQIVAGTSSNVLNMAGRFDFEQELNLISNLDLMIAMDSGNGHLASIYGVPVITAWGNTHPYAGFAPYAQPEQNQLCVDRTKYPLVPTSVFGNKKVKGYIKICDCISTVSIVERSKQLLKS